MNIIPEELVYKIFEIKGKLEYNDMLKELNSNISYCSNCNKLQFIKNYCEDCNIGICNNCIDIIDYSNNILCKECIELRIIDIINLYTDQDLYVLLNNTTKNDLKILYMELYILKTNSELSFNHIKEVIINHLI